VKNTIISGLAALTGAWAASASGQISATATLTPGNPAGGVYHYSAVLNNTGTTTIGTFWFAWIPGYDFMPNIPSNILSPAGWGYYIEGLPGNGYSVRWVAGSAADQIPAGGSLSGFAFDSTVTPAALLNPPPRLPNLETVTSFVYIGAPELDPGFEFNPTVGAPCYANCDNSTTPPALNVLDFSCFLNKFAAGDTYANCDGSTTPPVLNVLDFACFLNRFAAGCT
jgi:hypothetical protein